MIKKDYVLAAKIVSGERIPGFVKLDCAPEIRLEIAMAFVTFFHADSDKFNKNRFLEACGIDLNTLD